MASKSNLIIRDLSKRFLAQVGGSGEPPFFSNQHQQQWRAYAAQSFHRLKKPRGAASKFSNPLFSASPSLSFSSSTSKTGFVGWYLGVLESRPLLTKSISSSLIYAAADFTSQVHLPGTPFHEYSGLGCLGSWDISGICVCLVSQIDDRNLVVIFLI